MRFGMPIVKEVKQHKILLDTHVWIWLAQGNAILTSSAKKAIDRARQTDHLFISPISVWEISMLVERKKIILEMDTMDWLKTWIELPGIQIIPLTCQVAIMS